MLFLLPLSPHQPVQTDESASARAHTHTHTTVRDIVWLERLLVNLLRLRRNHFRFGAIFIIFVFFVLFCVVFCSSSRIHRQCLFVYHYASRTAYRVCSQTTQTNAFRLSASHTIYTRPKPKRNRNQMISRLLLLLLWLYGKHILSHPRIRHILGWASGTHAARGWTHIFNLILMNLAI